MTSSADRAFPRRSHRRQIRFAGALLFIVLLTLFLQIRWNPAAEPMRPDSGLFAYGGQQLLAGKTLYQDVWDHKPPGIYYLNALAIAIGGEAPWSVWWLSAISVVLAAALVFLTLFFATDLIIAIITAAVFILTVHHPSYYQGGNLTELYALVPNAAILLAFALYLQRTYRAFPVLVGALTAIAFLLKPNLISAGAATLATAIIRYRAFGHGLPPRRTGALAVLGLLLILTPIAVIFSLTGTLRPMIEAVFSANVSYSEQSFSLTSLYGTARIVLIEQPLAALVGMGLAASAPITWDLFRRLRYRDAALRRPGIDAQGPFKPEHWLLAATVLAVPMQIAAAAVTGRNFGHYFLGPVLTLSICAGFLVHSFRQSDRSQWRAATLALAIFLFAGWSLSTIRAVAPGQQTLRRFPADLQNKSYVKAAVHDYILDHSSADETVLVWSIHPSIYLLTDRTSPSSYVQMNQIVEPSAGGLQRFDEFMEDLQRSPPELIVAQPQSSAGIPYFAAAGDAVCPGCDPDVRMRMERLREFILTNYEHNADIADWVVFKLRR